MRVKFDKQLAELKVELINMGTMVEDAISGSVKALLKKDSQLAEEIKNNDKEIDHEQKKIENLCFNILLQQQPVAKDLRMVSAAMNMITDMERIGDHAADISEMALIMGDANPMGDLPHIQRMAAETMLMLNESIKAYVDKDIEKAKEVIKHDDIVDSLFNKVKIDIMTLIHNNPEGGEEVLDLLMVAKYFERIGDHSTNIAEWVLYAFDNVL